MLEIKPNEILNKYFEMRDNSHIVHLQTNSYEQHKTLNKFYDSILDLGDEFAEQYQGCMNTRITNVGNIKVIEGVNIISYLKDCKLYFENIHKKCELLPVKVTIESTIQEITKTLYLLTLTK